MSADNEEYKDQVLIHFRLFGKEAKALKAWAADERRRPTDQVRYLLRRELEKQGLNGHER
jgi:hypothetical protein